MQAEVGRMSSAHAVHMPKGVDSCIGVTLRLLDANASAESVAEREERAKLLTGQEISEATAGAEACKNAYLEAVAAGQTSAEPLLLALSYGVDPEGKVCAVIEKDRQEPIDSSAAALLEQSADCVKNALFASQFPAGRVKEKERIVLTYKLAMDPVVTEKAVEEKGAE